MPGPAGWWLLALPAAPVPAAVPAEDRRSFLRLSLVVITRSVVFTGLSTFIALYVRERGGGGTARSVALFAGSAGSAGGTLLGGRPVGAEGHRPPGLRRGRAAVAGILLLPAPLVPLCAEAAALHVPFSLQVALGQDYLPTRTGTASGVTLGLTGSVGGLASPLIGAAADSLSLRAALLPPAALPVPAWALARRLPEPAA
ncbi:hypothetical protein ACFWG6_21695 [Streptomyces erythrochromogenes]|uniref:hypothetical protein n=1 Tax=Streptomyces erythrochromogenes TaxID=285574 RepID=UPI00363B90D5